MANPERTKPGQGATAAPSPDPAKDSDSSGSTDEKLEDIDNESQALVGDSGSASTLRKRIVAKKKQPTEQTSPEEKPEVKQVAATKKWRWIIAQADEEPMVSKKGHRDGVWAWLSACRVAIPEPASDITSDTSTSHPAKSLEEPKQPVEGDIDSAESEKAVAKNLWLIEQTRKAKDLTAFDWRMLTLFSTVAIIVRLWRLTWPGEVVFDETHYGRYVNEYLNRRFFLDSHPPLATLMMTGISSYFGYNGTFSFGAIGDALCTPLAYVTLRASGHGALASILAATLVTFDNALIATHRLFTPEGLFFLFTALTIFAWTLFLKHTSQPFSKTWWLWLVSTGMAIGATISTKTTGLMTLSALYLAAAHDMWNQTCNLRNTSTTVYRHLLARAFALVVIPTAMFLAVWHIHFTILTFQPDLSTNAGAYDFKLLSRELQHSLIAPTKSLRMYREVAFGSVIRLQTEHTSGVALHSFYKSYTTGSLQQQVGGSLSFNDTVLTQDDPNTHWIVVLATSNPKDVTEVPHKTTYVKNGDTIRLRHVPTRLCLHSHNVRPGSDPLNKNLNEVSCYGTANIDGDSNDWWVVQVIEDGTNKAVPTSDKRKVHALSSRIRLRHRNTNCHLYTSDMLMPEIYGPNRWDISCRVDAAITPRSIWRVSMNLNDYLTADADIAEYSKPSFFQKLSEVLRLMMLDPQYTSLHESPISLAKSSAIKWPLLRNAIPAWRSYQRQVFIAGNPVVWGLCAIGLISFWLTRATLTLYDQRKYVDGPRLAVFRSVHLKWSTLMAVGWAVHYVPFFFLKRGLFLYHYFPAFYFSILLTASMFSGLCSLFIRPIRFAFLVTCIALTVVSFWYMSPLSYGSVLQREVCTRMTSWHILRPHWGGPGGGGGGGGNSGGINCLLTPPAGEEVMPLVNLLQKAKHDKALWHDKVEKYRQWSRAMIDVSKMPTSIAGQIRAVQRERRPPHSGSGGGASGGSSPFALEHNYPPEEAKLPREDVFLAPYQRPPQWLSSPQNSYDDDTLQSQRHRYNPEPNYPQHQRQRHDAEQGRVALDRQTQDLKKAQEESQQKQEQQQRLVQKQRDQIQLLQQQLEQLQQLQQSPQKARDADKNSGYQKPQAQENQEAPPINKDSEEGDGRRPQQRQQQEQLAQAPSNANLAPRKKHSGPVFYADRHPRPSSEEQVQDAEIEDDEGEGDDEVEAAGPTISVQSPEELEVVLASLKDAGMRAKVIRGTKTETIEAD
ncbi:hypothetical protein DFQ26_007794 [Actinomortierella ambigua]|nr:hypothetical protein DFQ26_007794 [Actinomortierella ambigua]